ncbi:MAG: class I SAM-dependent methyltransferase [Methanogenium sp.]|jgi:SAM-dependent methyltransferase
MSFYREALERWLKQIDIKAERVLDIGGASNPITQRVNSLIADEYVCLDLGAEEAKVPYIPFDINRPRGEQLKGYDKEAFKANYVFCLEVFEYVWNPFIAMKNIAKLLKPDGFAYISFPAIYPVHNPVEIDYLRYTRKSIQLYCRMVGLEIKEIMPRMATAGRDVLSQFYSLEGMHPVKNSPAPFEIGYLVKAYKPFEPKKSIV